jgi:L,D-transpeptidase YbiS
MNTDAKSTALPSSDGIGYFLVDVAAQKVRVIDLHEVVVWQTDVSTSRHGLGEEEGSNRTPRGWFHVAEKIGNGQPLGAIFQSRAPTGEIWTPEAPLTGDDLILTRILWLAGDEASNANTQKRYVYFHGTNHESRIGTADSHGCIRLRNADMLTLFDYAQVGTRVKIA